MDPWNIYLILIGITALIAGMLFLRYPEQIGQFIIKNLYQIYGRYAKAFDRRKNPARSMKFAEWGYIIMGVILIISGLLVPPEMML